VSTNNGLGYNGYVKIQPVPVGFVKYAITEQIMMRFKKFGSTKREICRFDRELLSYESAA